MLKPQHIEAVSVKADYFGYPEEGYASVNYDEHDNPIRITYPNKHVETRVYIGRDVHRAFFDDKGVYQGALVD